MTLLGGTTSELVAQTSSCFSWLPVYNSTYWNPHNFCIHYKNFNNSYTILIRSRQLYWDVKCVIVTHNPNTTTIYSTKGVCNTNAAEFILLREVSEGCVTPAQLSIWGFHLHSTRNTLLHVTLKMCYTSCNFNLQVWYASFISWTVFACNSCERTITEQLLCVLYKANEDSLF